MGNTFEESIAAARFNLEAAERLLAAGDAAAAAYPVLIALELAVDSAGEVAQVTAEAGSEASPHKRRRALARELEAEGFAGKGTERLLGKLDFVRTSGYRGEAPGPEALDVVRRAMHVTAKLLARLEPDVAPLEETEIDVGAAVESARLAHERELAALESEVAAETRREAEERETETRHADALAAATERAESTIATFLSVALPAGCPGMESVRLGDRYRRFRVVRAWVIQDGEYSFALRPEDDLRRLASPADEDIDELLDIAPIEDAFSAPPLRAHAIPGIARAVSPLQGDDLGRAARPLVRGIAKIVAREGLPWPEESVSSRSSGRGWPVIRGGPLAMARAAFALLVGLLPLLAAMSEPTFGLFGLLVLGYAAASILAAVVGGVSAIAAPVVAGLGLAAASGMTLFVVAAAVHAVLGLAQAFLTAVSGPWDRLSTDTALVAFGVAAGTIAWLVLVGGWLLDLFDSLPLI